MAYSDEVIVKFLGDNSQLLRTIQQVSTASSKAAGGGGVATAATRSTKQATGASVAFTRSLTQQNRAIANSSTMLKDLQTQTGNMSSSFRRSALSLQTSIGWLDKFSIQADRASMEAWKFAMTGISLQQLATVTGTVAVGMGLVTKKMVDSFSMVDRIKRQFSSIYKSAELGSQMVDTLVNDAVKIRYTVQEVLEAGRLLALEGFNPKDLIYDMADLAAGVNQEGITIVNATRAFVDATNGQFRRLKETFQVTREDAMAFAPDAFSGPNNQISNQAKATEAIIRAIQAKYRGMNEATMQTVGGMLSNVDDAMTKATAKMGAAIEGTVVGWLSVLMGLFDKIGKFAETDMGKATAKTLLWGTAIMASVTGLALLAAGMTTVIGLFAAYKVFMDARTGGTSQIINAELQLLKLNHELARIEANRGVADIERMTAQLKLSQAIRVEEEARAKAVMMRAAGISGPQIDAADNAASAAGRVRFAAQREYDRTALPMMIVKAENDILDAKVKEASLDGEQLELARAKTYEMEKQVALMYEQLAAVQQGGVAADVVGTSKTVANRPLMDLRASANAASAAVEAAEAKVRSLEASSAKSAMADSIVGRTPSTLEAAYKREQAIEQAKAEVEAARAVSQKRNALLKSAEAQAGTGRVFDTRMDIVDRLGPAKADQQLKSKLALDAQTELATHQNDLAIAKQRLSVAEQTSKLADARVLQGQRAWHVEMQNANASELSLSHHRRRDDLYKKLAQDARSVLDVERERVAALSGKLPELEEARRQASRDANRAATVLAREQTGSGIYGVTRPAESIARNMQLAQDKAILQLAIQQAEAAGVQTAASTRQLELDRARLVVIEEQLAGMNAQAAAAALTARNSGFSAGARAAGARFAGGAARGFTGTWDAVMGAMAGPLMGLVAGLKAAVASIAGAGGFVAVLGAAAGALLAILPVIVAVGGGIMAYKAAQDAQKQFVAGIKESVEALKTWSNLLKNPASTQAVQDNLLGMLDSLGKVKIPWLKTNTGVSVGKQLMEQDGMTPEKARSTIAKLREEAATQSGASPDVVARVREEAMSYSEDQVRNFRMDVREYELAYQGIASDLDESNAKLMQQGMALDKNARKWLETQINSGKLTAEQEKQYKEMLNMTHPAIAVAGMMKEEFEHARDAVPEVKAVSDALEAGANAGENEAEVFALISANAEQANASLAEMEQTNRDLADIDQLHAAEREKDLRDKREQVRLLNEQAKLFWIIVGLQKTQDAQGVASAAGMGNTGAIFGADIASAEWAAANGEKDPKKRMERIQSAFKAARGSREDSAKQSLDLFAPGPNANPQEKANYERYKAKVERERMSGVEEDYKKAMKFASPEQRERMQKQLAAEKNTSANAIEGFNKSALDIETQDYVNRMEVSKRGAALGGASDRELLNFDVQIAKAKMEQAIAAGDVAAQMDIQVGLAEKLKGLQETALGAEEAKLGYMESLVKQGLLPEDALTAEKQKLAQWYKYMASQSQAGSAQQYQYLQKSLDVMGEDTKDKWQGIIGTILGAPAALVNQVVSEGWMQKAFGDAANAVGMGKGIQADIIGNTRSEMIIRVKWDGLDAVGPQVQAALPAAFDAFGKQLTYSMR